MKGAPMYSTPPTTCEEKAKTPSPNGYDAPLHHVWGASVRSCCAFSVVSMTFTSMGFSTGTSTTTDRCFWTGMWTCLSTYLRR